MLFILKKQSFVWENRYALTSTKNPFILTEEPLITDYK